MNVAKRPSPLKKQTNKKHTQMFLPLSLGKVRKRTGNKANSTKVMAMKGAKNPPNCNKISIYIEAMYL